MTGRWMCSVVVLVAAYACDQSSGSEVDSSQSDPTLANSIPVYDDLWDPTAQGETVIKIRGIQLGDEEMAMAGLGLGDNSRAEFRIFRRGSELVAVVDLYSAAGVHLDSGERSYGVGRHTNWNHYADTDDYGMSIHIQHRKNGKHIYRLSPAINGLVAKKTANADSAKPVAPDGIHTLMDLPPPEMGLIVFQETSKSSRCASVRIKAAPTSSWKSKLPRLFETEDGSTIGADDNTNLVNLFVDCLRSRQLLK